jgi:hypothetical protein
LTLLALALLSGLLARLTLSLTGLALLALTGLTLLALSALSALIHLVTHWCFLFCELRPVYTTVWRTVRSNKLDVYEKNPVAQSCTSERVRKPTAKSITGE